MFAYIKDNQFQCLLPVGTPFVIGGIQYPANWLNLSTKEDKDAAGIVEVMFGARPDDKYYWVGDSEPVYANGIVSIEYTSTPKDLSTLRNIAITAIQQQAYSILLPSDWMVIKALETNSNVPTVWNDWRAKIRSQAADQIAAITSSTTVESLESLPAVQWENNPDYVPFGSL